MPVARHMRRAARIERNAPCPHAKREQAANGKLGAEWPSPDQPAAPGCTTDTGGAGCGRSAGDPATGLQTGARGPSLRTAATANHTGTATGVNGPVGKSKNGCAKAVWQEHGRKSGGEAADRDNVGPAGGALTVVQEDKPIALALRVEHAEREGAHERALLLAPVAVADRLHERANLAGNSGAAGPASLHELAHARVADVHARGCLRAREALQVAKRGGLALAPVQAPAQPLEQLAA